MRRLHDPLDDGLNDELVRFQLPAERRRLSHGCVCGNAGCMPLESSSRRCERPEALMASMGFMRCERCWANHLKGGAKANRPERERPRTK